MIARIALKALESGRFHANSRRPASRRMDEPAAEIVQYGELLRVCERSAVGWARRQKERQRTVGVAPSRPAARKLKYWQSSPTIR